MMPYRSSERYFHKDVIRIFPDLRPRTVISWAEKGLVKPGVEAKGRGDRRVYTYSNLVEIGFIHELVSLGIPSGEIKRTLKQADVKEALQDRAPDQLLVMGFHHVIARSTVERRIKHIGRERLFVGVWSPDTLSKDVNQLSSAVVVNLSKLRSVIDEGLKYYGEEKK